MKRVYLVFAALVACSSDAVAPPGPKNQPPPGVPVPECSVLHCMGSHCQFDDLPYGTPLPSYDQPGDCSRVICNGNGEAIRVPDDMDIGPGSNPCTLPGCTGGIPTHQPVGDGTACGEALHCVSGVCSGCTSSAQCPRGGPCDEAICYAPAGTCGLSVVEDGPAALQAPGDCQLNVCQQGVMVSIPDVADVPPKSPCAQSSCTDAGNVMTTSSPLCTPCTDPNEACDGKGACVPKSTLTCP